ncbi:DNA repair protein REV1 isoform X1 [Hemiscyllium ocellatum]|uniref:DNA repair protein REV1 isoform X1 n=1 Tax=Hemiscyllium ocellatum TaxID=170820 RepID=UPI002966C48C|nr:DNA repair protein REV1 isoform X1 [Hemiscyllium ocellatum]XP_060682613.1 DNA repair protein REV1 isoform X1 [Hemiscyllium ocellatum]
MSRGGWRKRASEGDGWTEWGGYMAAKMDKLERQFKSDASLQQQNEGTVSCIFRGVSIFVNGYTDPTADELRRLMMLHGGQYHMYYSRSKTTHIIATNLPNSKIKELKEEKVVRPSWITDSIKAGYLLSYIPYQLYTKQSSVQKGLNFTVSKPEESMPGPSNIYKLNRNIKSISHNQENAKYKENSNQTNNGMNGCDIKSEDFELTDLEHVFPNINHNGVHSYRDHFSLHKRNEPNSYSALKKQDYLKHCSESSWEKEIEIPERLEEENDDCEMHFRNCEKQFAEGNALLPDHIRTATASSLNECFKVNGANHSTVQGIPKMKSSSEPSPNKLSSHWSSKPADPSFISEFYAHSRLHHISTWKSEFADYVNRLQRQSNGIYPGREKLKRINMGKFQRNPIETNHSGTANTINPSRKQNCIMHVDMDCFFVSVGIRDRPDLKGKPVAVTHNRGHGHMPIRSNTNQQFEMQYYQKKLMKEEKKVPEKLDGSTWENPNPACVNGTSMDVMALSMAEIASCSYEARRIGIKNGMFFGQAKQLCPELQAVSYNFKAYKEVASVLYETLASYTCDIEAVSCDEALIDVTAICAETGLTPDEVATVIRSEIREKTKCTASVGMGSNILLARMATRKAKPDGQYYLKPEEVDDFIRDQLVSNLPGVGRTLENRMASIGVKTCGELQQILMSTLQKEFGPKTGQMLYRFCRGLDDRPVRTERERKSVSAEINYGIRFSQTKEVEVFLFNLAEEIQRRLEISNMKGKRLTLKVMTRKAGAPTEPAKFGGHGICDNFTRSVTLDHATSNGKIISREVLRMFHMMKLNVTDLRGVGIQMHHLIPDSKASFAPMSSFVQNNSTIVASCSKMGIFQASRTKEAMENRLSEDPDGMQKKTAEAGGSLLLPPHQDTNFNGLDISIKAGGVHTPENTVIHKLRRDLSIEVPSPSQIDPSVLAALPPDIREQVEQTYAAQQQPNFTATPVKESVKGTVTGQVPVSMATVILELPGPQEPSNTAGMVVALPAFSQVDPEVFAALPTDVQEELRAAYDQRHRQGMKNPLLQLKSTIPEKSKKRFKKKNQTSPTKVQNPLKNKLTISPHKVLPDLIRHEHQVEEKLQVDPGVSTSDQQHKLSSQCEISTDSVYLRANLAGAYELKDVKSLLKEWVTTIGEPVEEDILQVVKYCTDLIEEKDLEKLDLVIKYMKRLIQQSADSLWNMAFDFILDNVQVVMQQIYGSTLKFT